MIRHGHLNVFFLYIYMYQELEVHCYDACKSFQKHKQLVHYDYLWFFHGALFFLWHLLLNLFV